MKIISNFKDYYDSCQYMCGEDVVYERILNNGKFKKEKEEYKIPNSGYKIKNIRQYWEVDPRIKEFEEFMRKNHPRIAFDQNTGVILVGDKIVQTMLVFADENGYYNYRPYKGAKSKFIFDNFEEVKTDSYTFFTKGIKVIDEQELEILKRDIRKVFPEVPIVYAGGWEESILDEKDSLRITKVCLNPTLKKFNFKDCMQPHEVIQEVELFLKKLKETEKDVDFDDKTKIIQAGFDLKDSFRKRK